MATHVNDLKEKIPEIVSLIRTLDPEKIYLFGSLSTANGALAQDIDIAVVISSAHEPRNFEDRLALQVAVREAIYRVSQEVPIDLVVYTSHEFDELRSQNRPFIREIENGTLLYEKAG